MSIYTETIQKLYVAYFSRPADPGGLAYWERVVADANGATAAVAAAFAASAEYKAAYGGKSSDLVVDTVYMNLFGRHAEVAGRDYWSDLLNRGLLTIDVVVTAIARGAQGSDMVAYNSKVSAATAFTAALDQPTESFAYTGASANAKAIAFLAAVTNATTGADAIVPVTLAATVLVVTDTGSSQWPSNMETLGSRVERVVGTAGNDAFFANAASLNLGDQIEGVGGFDTLYIAETGIASSNAIALDSATLPLSSVEAVSITSSGGIAVDAKSWSEVSTLKLISNGMDGVAVAALASTKVSIIGAAMSYAAIRGSGNLDIDNIGAGGSGQGTSLAEILLDGFTGKEATIKAAGIALLTLSAMKHDTTITLSNHQADHSLSVKLKNVNATLPHPYYPVTVALVDHTAGSVRLDSAEGVNRLSLSGANMELVTLTGARWLDLKIDGAASTRLATINGAAATGHIGLTGLGASTKTIMTGAGADSLTLTTATARDNPATPGVDETISASVSTAAGNDQIFLRTSGDGTVAIAAGTGNDRVVVESRSGNEIYVIDLGAGDDHFVVTGGAIKPGDTVVGGEGLDTLALSAGSGANLGAFSGFERFDATGLNTTIDFKDLAPTNAMRTIVTSGGVGKGAQLLNVVPGTDILATGDMGDSSISISLASPAAQTLRLDMDEGSIDSMADAVRADYQLPNAASVRAVFETDFHETFAGETTVGDNLVTLRLVTAAATSITVESGGTRAVNQLYFSDLGKVAASMTITGAQPLNVVSYASSLVVFDASAHTGGLSTSTLLIGNGGLIKLGSGVDVVSVTFNSTPAATKSISGFEKAGAAAVDLDSAARPRTILDADTLKFWEGTVASANTVAGGAINSAGVLSFTTSPASLAAAFAIANLAAESNNEVVVFSYLSDSYVFMQGWSDTAVKLVGVTGITAIGETGNDQFFIV